MVDRDEVLVHLAYIKEGVDGVKAHLAALNGRTRNLEERSAVHSWAIGLGGPALLALVVWILSKLP